MIFNLQIISSTQNETLLLSNGKWGVTITYTKVMVLAKNHLHDKSNNLLYYAEEDQQYDSRSSENELLTLGILD